LATRIECSSLAETAFELKPIYGTTKQDLGF
jgi:hypothetical protein